MNTANTTIGDNLAPAIDALAKTLRSLGADEADGLASRPKMILAMTAAASRGEIDESYAATGYAAYLAGKRKRAGNSPLVVADDDSGKGFDANTSKLRQCIKVGMLPTLDGYDVIDRANTIGDRIRAQGDKTMSPVDGMVAVARAQLKDATQALTDDQIADLITIKAKEKQDLADLIAAYKTAHKLGEKYPQGPAAQAIDIYRRAIIEAGGEVPPVTADEKKAAEVTAFLRSRGMVATHAIAAE